MPDVPPPTADDAAVDLAGLHVWIAATLDANSAAYPLMARLQMKTAAAVRRALHAEARVAALEAALARLAPLLDAVRKLVATPCTPGEAAGPLGVALMRLTFAASDAGLVDMTAAVKEVCEEIVRRSDAGGA